MIIFNQDSIVGGDMKVGLLVHPKTGSTYVSGDLRRAGFVGKVPGYVTGMVLVLAKPSATVREIRQSLQVLLKELELE